MAWLHPGTLVAFGLLAGVAVGQGRPATAAPDRWQTTEGAKIDPLHPAKHPAVLVFVLTDCPIANLYAPELGRLATAYAAKGVSFTVVYVDPELGADAARKHAKEFGLKGVALLDPSHSLAKRLGATVSPEAVVLAPGGKIVYRGRIDDRAVDYGKFKPKASKRELRNALDAVLAGKAVPVARTKAVGCIFRAEGS